MADDPLPSAGSADSASEVNGAEMEIAPNFDIFPLAFDFFQLDKDLIPVSLQRLSLSNFHQLMNQF